MKLLVIYGGIGPEREVSLRSGKYVYNALLDAGYNVDILDLKSEVESIADQLSKYDLVVPIVHGEQGEDGQLQKLFADRKVKYLGSERAVCIKVYNKAESHKLFESNGVRMPQYQVVSKSDFDNSELSKKPFVLKPVEGGSSIDTVIAREVTDYNNNLCHKYLNRHGYMLLEELINGTEVTVPVLDNKALEVVLIQPPDGMEFDYENKYNGSTKEICPIPSGLVSEDKQLELRDLALRIHRMAGVRHLSRSDFIISDDGDIYMLEINTMPGMTDESLFPKSAKAAGMSMSELCDQLVRLATE